MDNLDGDIKSIGELFSGDFFFTIPDYQRPFAWEDDNFQDLIDDIISAQSGDKYFLGTLVLHNEISDGPHSFNVVDGQQRLTSLLILLACLRDLIEDHEYKSSLQNKILQAKNKVDGIPERARVTVKERAKFNELILEFNGTDKKYKADDLSESEKRYIQAIQIFKKSVDKFTQLELGSLATFISTKCTVVYLSTIKFGDAFNLFTIVNDRGRQLRRIDILKAQNISPQAIPIEFNRRKVAELWETMEGEIGEDSLESILYSMRMILIKEKPQENLLEEFEKRIFAKGLLKRGEKFVDEVKAYCDLYRLIFTDKDFIPKNDQNHLKFKAMIHIMNSEFDASEWKSCLMFFAKKFNGEQFYEFMLVIEKVYLAQWCSGVRKDERFGEYSKILRLIDDSEKPNLVISGITFDTSAVIKAASSKNLYGSRYAKYFLMKLEIVSTENDIYKEINAKSIEHVFPQNPAANSMWEKDPDFSKRSEYVDMLGNLVLLSKSKNSSASNHDFDVKKEKYLKDRLSDYPRSLKITTETSWTIDKIKQYTAELACKVVSNP